MIYTIRKEFISLFFLLLVATLWNCTGKVRSSSENPVQLTQKLPLDNAPSSTAQSEPDLPEETGPQIYVTDRRNLLVKMDNMDGSGWTAFKTSSQENTSILNPTAVSLDSFGKIYFVEQQKQFIGRMDDITGTNLVTLGNSHDYRTFHFRNPFGIFIKFPGGIYLAGLSQIARIEDMTGTGATYITYDGDRSHLLRSATGVAVDQYDRIYAVDSFNNRIVRFDDFTLKNWISIGSEGSGINQFRVPTGVFVDSNGLIYITDSGNHRIVRIDDISGSGWTTFGPQIRESETLDFPFNIFVDRNGKIYITDFLGNRIIRLDDFSGTHPKLYPSGKTDPDHVFSNPQGIFVQ